MKENQIYKWFWDTKKKVEEDTELAKKMNLSGPKRRAWANTSRGSFKRLSSDNLSKKSNHLCIGVDGKDGHGEQMTP